MLSLIGNADLVKLHKKDAEVSFGLSDRVKLTETEIRQMIIKYTNGAEPIEIGLWEKSKRNAMLANLRQAGLSFREIERATAYIKRNSRKMLTKKERTLLFHYNLPKKLLFIS